jgi:UDP-3-O-[3-hydroxymyristoyl] glucosamine N-acyltransferase
VRFTSSVLRQLNEQFQALKATYDDVQSKLADEVIKIASKTSTTIFKSAKYRTQRLDSKTRGVLVRKKINSAEHKFTYEYSVFLFTNDFFSVLRWLW